LRGSGYRAPLCAYSVGCGWWRQKIDDLAREFTLIDVGVEDAVRAVRHEPDAAGRADEDDRERRPLGVNDLAEFEAAFDIVLDIDDDGFDLRQPLELFAGFAGATGPIGKDSRLEQGKKFKAGTIAIHEDDLTFHGFLSHSGRANGSHRRNALCPLEDERSINF
jgi:hypothetical protein